MIIPRITIALIAFLPGLISAPRPGVGPRRVIRRMEDVTPLVIEPPREEHVVPVEPTPSGDSLSVFEWKQLLPYLRNDIPSMCFDFTSPECQLFRAAILPGWRWDSSLLKNKAAARAVFDYLVPSIGLHRPPLSWGVLGKFLRRTLLAKVLFIKFGVPAVRTVKARAILNAVEPSRLVPKGLNEKMLINAARKRPLLVILAALRSVQSYSSSPMSDAIMLLGKSGERVHPA